MNEQDLLNLKLLLNEFIEFNQIDVDEYCNYNLDDIFNYIEKELDNFEGEENSDFYELMQDSGVPGEDI